MASQIKAFYQAKNVLITGGNGFLGSVLVQKLVRSTDVDKIYVILRAKNGYTPAERFKRVLNQEIFVGLKDGDLKRITTILGEVSEPDFGLSSQDFNAVKDTNIIFNSAASIQLNENIKCSYKSNVSSTVNLVNFAKKLPNLEAVVHVSTAYCNYQNKIVKEEVESCEVDPVDLGEKLEKMTFHEADQVGVKLIPKEFPNVYTFTKRLGEIVVKNRDSGLKFAIIRPATITATYKDPIPFWNNSMGAFSGYTIAAYFGKRNIYGPLLDVQLDLVPVDKVAAATIAIPWHISHQTTANTTPVYNFVLNKGNNITIEEALQLINISLRRSSKHIFSVRRIFLLEGKLYHIIDQIFYNFPARIAAIFFNKPQALKFLDQINGLGAVVKAYKDNALEFKDENFVDMWRKMNDTDRKIFDFDMDSVRFIPYIRGYLNGLRKYCFKDLE